MRPDRDIVLPHQPARRHCDLSAPRYHPADDADPGRKYDRALRRHLPELPRKYFIGKRQHKGQRNHICRMRMVNDPVFPSGDFFFHLVVHQMARQLTRRTSAMHQSPADTVFASCLIDLQNAGRIRRIKDHVPEILSTARHHKIFSGQLRHTRTNLFPLTGHVKERADFLHLFRL